MPILCPKLPKDEHREIYPKCSKRKEWDNYPFFGNPRINDNSHTSSSQVILELEKGHPLFDFSKTPSFTSLSATYQNELA